MRSLILKLNIKCHSCMLNALTVIIHSIIVISIRISISSGDIVIGSAIGIWRSSMGHMAHTASARA